MAKKPAKKATLKSAKKSPAAKTSKAKTATPARKKGPVPLPVSTGYWLIKSEWSS